MKTISKWLALFVVLTLALALMTGCSGSGSGASATPEPEKEAAEEPETAEEAEEAEEPESAEETEEAEEAEEPEEAEEAEEAEDETPWPEKPVTIIAPYNAGGDTDFNARLLAEKLTERFGQNFIVQNVAGNSGATGSRQALTADPDGYTILFNHTAFVINYFAGNSDLTLDDMTFGAVVGSSSDSNILVCHPDLGITKMSELKEYTQEHPGELLFAGASGTTVLVTGMRLVDAGLDVTVVDTGDASERLAAFLGDHVDLMIASVTSNKDYLETGEMVEVENDLGISFNCLAYYQMNFPKGTDQAIVDKLDAALEDIILNDPDYAERIDNAYGQVPLYMNAAEEQKFMEDMWDEFSQWDWG